MSEFEKNLDDAGSHFKFTAALGKERIDDLADVSWIFASINGVQGAYTNA